MYEMFTLKFVFTNTLFDEDLTWLQHTGLASEALELHSMLTNARD